MPAQLHAVAERPSARAAHVLAHARVARHVAAQVRRRREALAAHVAPVLVDSAVQVLVLQQPAPLREPLAARPAAQRATLRRTVRRRAQLQEDHRQVMTTDAAQPRHSGTGHRCIAGAGRADRLGLRRHVDLQRYDLISDRVIE